MKTIETTRDYNRRFEKQVAVMTVADFQKWNPRFTVQEAEEKITQAKAFVAKLPPNPLQEEVDARINEGTGEQITLREMTERLKAIGYRLDRTADCRSNHHYVTGPRAGKSHPGVSLRPVQIDDGKAAWHYEARRDDNFRKLQTIRDQIFFVSKGAIHEI